MNRHYIYQITMVSLVAQMVKNPPAIRETWVWSLSWEDPLAEGMATHSSILVWRIPMDRGAWQATVYGAAELDMTERLNTHVSYLNRFLSPSSVKFQVHWEIHSNRQTRLTTTSVMISPIPSFAKVSKQLIFCQSILLFFKTHLKTLPPSGFQGE